MPRELPIIFNTKMVRAILNGNKTMTRRLVRPQPWKNAVGQWLWEKRKGQHIPFHPNLNEKYYPGTKLQRAAPYSIGDHLWVRETWLTYPKPITEKLLRDGADTWPFIRGIPLSYAAGEAGQLLSLGWIKKPSIHMSKWAARIWLEVIDVKVERVQDISEEDAIAEGLFNVGYFAETWEALYPGSWGRNDWVFAYTFRRLERK